MNYSLSLPSDQVELLEKLASRLGISVEQAVTGILLRAMEEERVLTLFEIILLESLSGPPGEGGLPS